ncbi:MAG: hypothetical protein LBM08_02980 [Dysgonamonadaceae bacterium]|jgi:hypothetical protein|nr:hypothetical protein [Dysgonamonadaceae bacterium]
MIETISLDSKTILIRADKENDISEVIDYIVRKMKGDPLDDLLNLAALHKVLDKEYRFKWEECYE